MSVLQSFERKLIKINQRLLKSMNEANPHRTTTSQYEHNCTSFFVQRPFISENWEPLGSQQTEEGRREEEGGETSML